MLSKYVISPIFLSEQRILKVKLYRRVVLRKQQPSLQPSAIIHPIFRVFVPSKVLFRARRCASVYEVFLFGR